MECPNCKANLDMVANMPDEQTIFFSIQYEGDWIAADTVAGTMKNASALMRAIAKDIGFKAGCFLHSLEMKPHEVKIGMRVVRVKGKPSNAKLCGAEPQAERPNER